MTDGGCSFVVVASIVTIVDNKLLFCICICVRCGFRKVNHIHVYSLKVGAKYL